MKVKVRDGVASEILPNFDAEGIHPANGRCCVKAYGTVQKTYNPGRVLTPMKRSNPKKGRNEDPGFVAISWDEALDTICERLQASRQKGLLDEAGLPRVAATFGMGGTPVSYMGTFPAFLAAWGPVDFSFGSGQGVKCHEIYRVVRRQRGVYRGYLCGNATCRRQGTRREARQYRTSLVGHSSRIVRMGADQTENR
jgi:phenylacetyl-CoA:acceptor oxidoreductase